MKYKSFLFLLAIFLLLVGCFSGCSLYGTYKLDDPEFLLPTIEVPKDISDELHTSESQNTEEEVSKTSTSDTVISEIAAVEPATLSIVMVGDILLHDRVEEAAHQEDGSYDYRAIFTHLKEDIQGADAAIVNQEVIIGGKDLGISGYPAFNAAFSMGDALVDAGFDIVCHGTNHALDKGRKGLLNCLDFWKENYPDIAVLGIHDSRQSQNAVYIYEQNDFKIAVLNYTYGTNGIPMPEGMPYAVDLLEEEKVIADIKKAEEMADFTIVCPHWGTEYKLIYSANQEKWAKLFAANGVDLVLGTHPHVIQPIEWVTDEATGHEMLVYYSLGNFVNWTGESGQGIANRMVGGMAKVTLTIEDGETFIAEYGVEPVVSHLEKGTNGVTVYRLSEYTEELASQNEIIHQDSTFSLEYCKKLCEDVFGALYIKE